MTTLIYLIRHGAHALIDHALVGRAGVPLSPRGRRQAHALGRRFAPEPISRVETSPRRRAMDTARPIADALALPLDLAQQMDELNVGEWSGRSFAELERDPFWRQWNRARSSCRPPGGESMGELQARVLDHLEGLRAGHPGAEIIIVSHAEPIRAAILHYCGLSLDEFAQIRVEPASVTLLQFDRRGHGACSIDAVAEGAAP